MPPAIERWPSGGYFRWPTIALASSAVSTCGMTMPSAPPSSTRVASEYCCEGTRTTGEMPAVNAATEICTAVSSGMVPCSRSMKSQSKPQLAIAAATSTVRAWRSPMPRQSSPLLKRSRAGLRTFIAGPLVSIRPSCAWISEQRGASRVGPAASSLEAGPAVGQQPLLRQEPALVIHLLRALHPIAQIDVAQTEPARARDVVEDHEGADRAGMHVGVEERIDHRQAVAEPVGQGDAQERSAAATGGRGLCIPAAVLDDAGVDVAVLDHHRIVEH